MKRVVKKKALGEGSGTQSVVHTLFRSFARLAEQAPTGRPLLRGLRIAHDPAADRFVLVHSGSRVEFVLRAGGAIPVLHAEVECKRMNSAGVTEEIPLARVQFNESGVVTESSITDLVNEKLDESSGAWSIVSAVMWTALESPA